MLAATAAHHDAVVHALDTGAGVPELLEHGADAATVELLRWLHEPTLRERDDLQAIATAIADVDGSRERNRRRTERGAGWL
jgi:hypothetical protein